MAVRHPGIFMFVPERLEWRAAPAGNAWRRRGCEKSRFRFYRVGQAKRVGGFVFCTYNTRQKKLNFVKKFSSMQTITVELLNDDALALLQQLERLNIIKLRPAKIMSSAPTLKKQWAGRLSGTTASEMLQHIELSRKEWQRI